jgi:hypothetical protein
VGLTVIAAVIAALLHTYLLPKPGPATVAVKVTGLPIQIDEVAGFTVTTGAGLTLTVLLAVAVHPFALVTVTVYVVVTVGVTTIESIVLPVFQA